MFATSSDPASTPDQAIIVLPQPIPHIKSHAIVIPKDDAIVVKRQKRDKNLRRRNQEKHAATWWYGDCDREYIMRHVSEPSLARLNRVLALPDWKTSCKVDVDGVTFTLQAHVENAE